MHRTFLRAVPLLLAALLLPSLAAANDAPLRGDANGNGIVDISDYTIVSALQGTTDPAGDIDENGVVNIDDVQLVVALFNSTWGRRLLGDVNGDGLVDITDLMELNANLGIGGSFYDVTGDDFADHRDIAIVFANLFRPLGGRLLGDVNGDDIVDPDDLRCIRQNLGSGPSSADVDLDGVVTMTDYSLAQATFGWKSGQRLTGDVNGDCVVDETDRQIVLAQVLTQWTIGDINGDGWTDGFDYALVLANFGNTCGRTRLSGDVNGDCLVDGVDLDIIQALFFTRNPMADVNGDGIVDNFDYHGAIANLGAICSDVFIGDVDGNCVVDQRDLDIVAAVDGTAYAPADVNHDGVVDSADSVIVQLHFGYTCP